jgi:hypothetical protein
VTDPAPGRRLLVDADLHLSIDGVDATFVGRGGELTLRTDEPARLSSALRRSGLLAALRQHRGQRAITPLALPALTIEGPRGRVARIAPDVRGVRMRALPAGTRLHVDRPLDVVPAAATTWGVALAGLAVAWVIHRIRRR